MVVSVYPNGTSTKTSTEGTAPCEALRFLLDNADWNVYLLLPAHSGYVIQSDFLERRMVDCPDVIKVQSLVSPGQQIKGCTAETYQSMSFSRTSRKGAMLIGREIEHRVREHTNGF